MTKALEDKIENVKATKQVYIFDSKIYAYNALHKNTAVTQIFEDMMRDLVRLKKRGKIYIAYDVGHSDYREGQQAYYKGHRRVAIAKQSQEEQDAHKQFNVDYIKLIDLFKTLDVTVVAVNGVEADDLMSLVALKHPEDKVTILTADFDTLHSVVGTDNVRLYSGRNYKFFDHQYVVDNYGVSTRRAFTLLKAISSDKGDNLLAFRNMGPVKSQIVYDSLPDDPTDEDAINAIEVYIEANPRIKVHEEHVNEGRTTVESAFRSNMLVAATFTDTDKMTDIQRKEYAECFLYTRTSETFEEASIRLFGFPIMLSLQAKRVFNAK